MSLLSLKSPFVSITNFTKRVEVDKMVEVLKRSRGIYNCYLGVGPMMSFKTLNGFKTTWSTVFPKNNQYAGIFIDDINVVNVLHYADYSKEVRGGHRDHTLMANLPQAVRLCGPHLHAIQLDMIWPDPDQVKMFRNQFPNIEIIFQANGNALEEVGNDPSRLVRKLRKYDDSINGVLLDKSMGEGKELNAGFLFPFMCEIRAQLPQLVLAAAGGLGPGQFHLLEPLAQEHPFISCDAQSKICVESSAKKPIDLSRCETYFKEFSQGLDTIRFERSRS